MKPGEGTHNRIEYLEIINFLSELFTLPRIHSKKYGRAVEKYKNPP